MPLPLPELPGVEHRFLELPTGVRAHVAEAGRPDAPPLVLVHGWPQHWWCWRRLIPLLAGDFRLLAPDLRAFGWSGRPPDGDLRKRRFAEDAVALLEALGIERAGYVGHDWGGWAGFHAVTRAPERWSGLLALGILHPWVPYGTLARNLHRFAYQALFANPLVGPRLLRDHNGAIRVIKSAWGDRSTFDEAEAEPFAAAYAQPEQAADSSRLYRVFLLREAGRDIPRRPLQVPTRLVIGSRDPLGASLAEGLERHGADARTELLDGCGHFVAEERPAETAAAARALFGAGTAGSATV